MGETTGLKPILLTLPSLAPSLALEILPYGLTVHRIFVQPDGRTHDLVVGPELPEDHQDKKYTNTIIGRYTNRIPVGTHHIERNGIRNQLHALANENPQVSLHGGPKGFDCAVWELITMPELFTPSELANLPETTSASSHAIFRFVSPDGDQGYPGKLIVEVLISLVSPGEQQRKYKLPGEPLDNQAEDYDLGSIVFVYRAKLDASNPTVTPINITQHWGFNLDASLKDGPDSLSVKDHILTIKADKILELDSLSLATGESIPVTQVPAHAHNHKHIGDKFPEKGYDDYYIFSPSLHPDNPVPKRIPLSSFSSSLDLLKDILRPTHDVKKSEPELRSPPAVELASRKSGLKLVFDTNQSGVMFYSNNLAQPEKGTRKKIHGGSGIKGQGDGYGPGSAAFLEFHEPLAAFLDPQNKDGNDTLLTADEIYHNYVRVDVKFSEPQM